MSNFILSKKYISILPTCFISCYGAGGLFGEPRRPGWVCCCNRNDRTYERRCTIVPRKYEYDDDGRRFHYDDLGRRCYFPHRNRYLKTVTTKTAISPEHEVILYCIFFLSIGTDRSEHAVETQIRRHTRRLIRVYNVCDIQQFQTRRVKM